MKTKQIIKRVREVTAPFRITNGDKFRLKDIDPGDTLGYKLVVRVHPEYLAKQKLPPELVGKSLWQDRFQDIRSFER